MALKLADIYQEIARMHRDGVPGVVATVVRAEGSTPRSAGAHMIVYADGRTLGSVGGGAIEGSVIDEAVALAAADPDALGCRLVTYDLGNDVGMACGGSIEVFLEPIAPAPAVTVIGGGHVGLAVAKIARQAGFHVIVIDDREDMVSAERFPFADRRFVGGAELLDRELHIDRSSMVVVVTRGHRYDKDWIRVLLSKHPAYLGMIGSEQKVEAAFDDLEAEGIPRDELSRIHAPIGLDIGAETPDEIAVSVVAEIIAERHGISDTAMLRDKAGFKNANRPGRSR
ncbi:XdhC family protein [bacterium]|nr:XdhC family protein [bacterium]